MQVPSYPARRSSKRPRPEDDDGDEGEERGLGLHLQMLPPELHSQDTEQSPLLLSAHSDRSHHGLSSSTFQLPAVQQQHHHHRLPTQATPSKVQRTGAEMTSPGMQSGPPSVVGQAGMPDPAPRPRGPKLKFTQEEDALLVDLKENKNLTWKQIADFFPGRTSGTLQVRYCTKLKAKTTTWTDETVSLYCPNISRSYNRPETDNDFAGSTFAQCDSRVRERPLASHCSQSRKWLFTCCLQRKSCGVGRVAVTDIFANFRHGSTL